MIARFMVVAIALAAVAAISNSRPPHSPLEIVSNELPPPGAEQSFARLLQTGRSYAREAQRSGDSQHHTRALRVAERLLSSAPHSPDALILKAVSQAGLHRFTEAVESAEAALRWRGDDADAFGVLADAFVELGRYADAVIAAQSALGLRPSASAYARAAYLRQLHGDEKGGLALMRLAVDATPPRPSGERVWALAHLGTDSLAAGDSDGARRAFREALALDPGDPLSLQGLAALHAARGEYDEAIRLYRVVIARGPAPDAHVALAELLASLERDAEAGAHYAAAERLERDEIRRSPSTPELRHLVLLYADRGERLDGALVMAEAEARRREDIYTADALAWALHRNGRHAEALRAARRALRLGTRDPLLRFHAGVIAAAAGEPVLAAVWLDEALQRPVPLGPLRVAHASRVRAGLPAS
jgi:tetratricopeptide (TPR) repeat protein